MMASGERAYLRPTIAPSTGDCSAKLDPSMQLERQLFAEEDSADITLMYD